MGFQCFIKNINAKPVSNMKYFVVFCCLLVGMAKSLPQEKSISDQVEEINKGLPPHYTPICVPPPQADSEVSQPKSLDSVKNNAKNQGNAKGPKPCWHLVDEDFKQEDCKKHMKRAATQTSPTLVW